MENSTVTRISGVHTFSPVTRPADLRQCFLSGILQAAACIFKSDGSTDKNGTIERVRFKRKPGRAPRVMYSKRMTGNCRMSVEADRSTSTMSG
jgi:hypothetical protein